MEQTIILNSGQKIEVYMPDQIELDIDCHVAYVKSGQAEIQNYVDTVSKPEIDVYVAENSEPLVREIVVQKTQPLIEAYVNADVLPILEQYVATGENLLNQTATVAETATQAQNASLDSATRADIAATSAATAADKAESSVQTIGEMLISKADDSAVVHLTGDETVTGVKTFTDNLTAPNVANTELSNLADGVQETITGWGVPDYSAGVSKSVNTLYTAEYDGMLYMLASGAQNTKLYIDDVLVMKMGGSRADVDWETTRYIGKGSAYKYTLSTNAALLQSLIFYPLKGVNNA